MPAHSRHVGQGARHVFTSAWDLPDSLSLPISSSQVRLARRPASYTLVPSHRRVRKDLFSRARNKRRTTTTRGTRGRGRRRLCQSLRRATSRLARVRLVPRAWHRGWRARRWCRPASRRRRRTYTGSSTCRRGVRSFRAQRIRWIKNKLYGTTFQRES